jgi:hypothetical protein
MFHVVLQETLGISHSRHGSFTSRGTCEGEPSDLRVAVSWGKGLHTYCHKMWVKQCHVYHPPGKSAFL